MFYARRASAYGVTVSYIPAFRKVSELIFGDPTIFWNLPKGAKEIHVDREMNVWGSGGAHSAYFKVVDEIIIDLFNQPIDQQPKGIVDMGCGNGAFLIHLYEVIERQTLRGTMLEEYPLFLVGADYNTAALKVTRANIIQADIWAKLIFGDIGRPDLLAKDLDENYGIQLKELLNVRTFLDHNRIWSTPEVETPNRTSDSTGAFAFRGKRISNTEVEDNLKEHFQKWSPFVEKFGLLVIELHTISPKVTARNIGKTAATAYDATHGFSDQYIVEIEVFHKIAEEAGLFPVERYFTKFPNSELATVSINLLRAKEV
jgi:SAM-dependent methyltransferase